MEQLIAIGAAVATIALGMRIIIDSVAALQSR
jgi:hypothetical protein